MRKLDEVIQLVPPEALRFTAKSLGLDSTAAAAWDEFRAIERAGGKPICVSVGEGSPLYVLDVRELLRNGGSTTDQQENTR